MSFLSHPEQPQHVCRESLTKDGVVAQRTALFESKGSLPNISNLRNLVISSGNGVVESHTGEFRMAISGAGDYIKLETAEYGRFVPGMASEVLIGCRMGSLPSGTQQYLWGYFDDSNGLGFGCDVSGLYTWRRFDGALEIQRRSTWQNTMPQLELLNGHTYSIEYYYGYDGAKFLIDGTPVNEIQTISEHTLIDTPNMPITAVVSSNGNDGDGSLYVACRAYYIHGTYNPNQRDNGAYVLNKSIPSTGLVPIISFRKKSNDFARISTNLKSVRLLASADCFYQVRYNGTLYNASFSTPTDTRATETCCEADTSATDIAGGDIINPGGFVSDPGGGSFSARGNLSEEVYFELPSSGSITLCARAITATATISAVVAWREDW